MRLITKIDSLRENEVDEIKRMSNDVLFGQILLHADSISEAKPFFDELVRRQNFIGSDVESANTVLLASSSEISFEHILRMYTRDEVPSELNGTTPTDLANSMEKLLMFKKKAEEEMASEIGYIRGVLSAYSDGNFGSIINQYIKTRRTEFLLDMLIESDKSKKTKAIWNEIDEVGAMDKRTRVFTKGLMKSEILRREKEMKNKLNEI